MCVLILAVCPSREETGSHTVNGIPCVRWENTLCLRERSLYTWPWSVMDSKPAADFRPGSCATAQVWSRPVCSCGPEGWKQTVSLSGWIPEGHSCRFSVALCMCTGRSLQRTWLDLLSFQLFALGGPWVVPGCPVCSFRVQRTAGLGPSCGPPLSWFHLGSWRQRKDTWEEENLGEFTVHFCVIISSWPRGRCLGRLLHCRQILYRWATWESP